MAGSVADRSSAKKKTGPSDEADWMSGRLHGGGDQPWEESHSLSKIATGPSQRSNKIFGDHGEGRSVGL